MHGDFSRNPLAYRDAVSRVMTQQGRVQLDADANEQTESMLRFLRGLAFDLIGAHGGVDTSFKISKGAKPADLLIGWGAYYVDGVRALNMPPNDLWQILGGKVKPGDGLPFKNQPWYFPPNDGDWTVGFNSDTILLYLDVFERHVSPAEDESLAEVALLGADTSSRAVIAWQVRALDGELFKKRLAAVKDVPPIFDKAYIALNLMLRSSARLRAHAIVSDATDACTVSPDARFRGTSNSLFRVEIHRVAKDNVTFKWSEDNGSNVYPVRKIAGKVVHLDSVGRDERTAIRVNDYVEVVDDEVLLNGKALDLLQVTDVNLADMTVTLSEEPQENAGSRPERHPILRRWAEDERRVEENKASQWIELADGVEVQFTHEDVPDTPYRTGDYWLIPARTATGDVIWPRDDKNEPLFVAPHGVDHHYAPLVMWNRITNDPILPEFRRAFQPLAKIV